MEQRKVLRIYDLLRRLGHEGTEDEIAERIMATRRGGVRTDVIAEQYPCSAPRDSAEWRENRARVVSVIVGSIVRHGRAAYVMPDVVGVPCEPDGDGVAEDPDADADGPSDEDDVRRAISELVNAVKNCDLEAQIDAAESMLDDMDWAVGEAAAAVQPLQEDESEDVRLYAFHTLCHLGADADAVVPTIIGHLRGESQLARNLAVNTLGNAQRYSSAAAVPYLIEILTEPNSDAGNRVWATSALGFCGVDAEGAVPALACGLTDEDKWVRDRSAAALMAIGSAAKEALPALLKARRSEDSSVRVYAVGALLRLGPAAESGVPALIDGLMDGDVEERENDADILGSIGPAAKEAAPALLEAFPALRDNAARALGSIGPAAKEAVPTLLDALPTQRKNAFRALRRIGAATEEIAPVLVGMTQSEDRHDRRFAAEALVEIGAETDVAVAVLIDSLNDDSSATRYFAARTVGKIGPRAESAVPTLSAALNDENTRVRDAAKAALERIVPVAAG